MKTNWVTSYNDINWRSNKITLLFLIELVFYLQKEKKLYLKINLTYSSQQSSVFSQCPDAAGEPDDERDRAWSVKELLFSIKNHLNVFNIK